MCYLKWLLPIVLLTMPAHGLNELMLEDEIVTTGRYKIEGRVYPDQLAPADWMANTRIMVNGGEYLGFLRDNGSFVVHGVPTGSYIVEVVNADYMYEPIRVEINSKGKYRARIVNHIQTSQVIQVPYPLKMRLIGKFRYFQVREQWKITDFLFNPMVLMMVLPLLLIMVLPKMMNDPETKKEMEQLSSFTKMSDMPEMSEMITSFFSGGQSTKANTKALKANKKRL